MRGVVACALCVSALLREALLRDEVPSARVLRSFFILCTVITARVASTGAATMLTTEAHIIAKKQERRDGLYPKSLYTLIEVR